MESGLEGLVHTRLNQRGKKGKKRVGQIKASSPVLLWECQVMPQGRLGCSEISRELGSLSGSSHRGAVFFLVLAEGGPNSAPDAS